MNNLTYNELNKTKPNLVFTLTRIHKNTKALSNIRNHMLFADIASIKDFNVDIIIPNKTLKSNKVHKVTFNSKYLLDELYYSMFLRFDELFKAYEKFAILKKNETVNNHSSIMASIGPILCCFSKYRKGVSAIRNNLVAHFDINSKPFSEFCSRYPIPINDDVYPLIGIIEFLYSYIKMFYSKELDIIIDNSNTVNNDTKPYKHLDLNQYIERTIKTIKKGFDTNSANEIISILLNKYEFHTYKFYVRS